VTVLLHLRLRLGSHIDFIVFICVYAYEQILTVLSALVLTLLAKYLLYYLHLCLGL